MRFIRMHARSQQDDSVDARRARRPAASAGFEPSLTRFEPELRPARRLCADPYAVWLTRREQEQRSEEPATRWVYRYPGGAGAREGQRDGGRREASTGTEEGLIGVA
jgi:hypothetical protein